MTWTYPAGFKQPVGQARHANHGRQREKHGQRLEREILRVVLVAPKVHQGCHIEQLLPSDPPRHQTNHIAGHGAVGVHASHVNHAEQLWEEDDVDQVAAQVPETVDGLDGQCHHCCQNTDENDAYFHYPEYFALWCLKEMGGFF